MSLDEIKYIFLTTSHGQEDSVSDIFTKIISSLSRLELSLSIFIVVESSACSLLSVLDLHESSTCFRKLCIKHVPSSYFWTESVLAGLRCIYDSDLCSLHDDCRIILFNSDISFSDWSCLMSANAVLESYITVDSQCIIQRSGFNFLYPLPLNLYPYRGVKRSESSLFFVDSVPTRLVVFPASAVFSISKLDIIKTLPHYGGDFAFTYFLSKLYGCKWCVRTDQYLIEDKSFSGVKSLSRLSFSKKLFQIFNIKSTFHAKSSICFPVLIARIRGFSITSPVFVLLCWLKYLVRFGMALLG